MIENGLALRKEVVERNHFAYWGWNSSFLPFS